LKAPLVAIEPHTGEMKTVENRLNRGRPAESRDQDVGRGAVAVHDRSPDEVVNGRAKPVPGHQLGERLDRQAQVLFPDDDSLRERPRAMIHGIHHRDANEKLHHALERESLSAIHTRRAGRVLHADANAPIEAARRPREIGLKARVLNRSRGDNPDRGEHPQRERCERR
jgi:hypothetical protein